MPVLKSRIGLCSFHYKDRTTPKVPRHTVLVYQMFVFLAYNGCPIPVGRLKCFNSKQLVGMLQRVHDGEGTWMLNRLLRQFKYDPIKLGFPPAEMPDFAPREPELTLFDMPKPTRARAS